MTPIRQTRAFARPRAIRHCLPVAFASLLAAAAVHAQEGGSAAPIVITASRVEQSVADALPSVTVVSRQDIESTQSRDLVELLGRQAGLEFARSGGQGAQSSLFLRGTNSNQVLVLLDGVRMNTVLGGAANLGGIPTDAIERIEIVRGNLSSLYGSEAIGGVVQIFTRAGSQPGADALLEAGQGRTRDASASMSTPVAGAMLSISAGCRSQQAISAIDVARVPFVNPAIDGNSNRNGALRLDERGMSGEFSAWAWGNHSDTHWADPFNSSIAIPSTEATQVEHRSQDAYGLLAARRFGDSKVSLSVSETRDDSVNVSNVPNNDPANDFPTSDSDNSQFRSRNRQATIEDTTTIARGVDLIAGLEHLNQVGAATSYDPMLNNQLTGFARRVDSLWAGTAGRRGSQQWQLNVRRDRYSDFGSATTGMLGWGWWIDPSWKLTAQASSAFRAPSFNELYSPPQYGGNPALRPERARSQELGLRWAQGGARASVAVFRNRVADLVGPGPDYVLKNVGHAAMDGIEWQAAAVAGSLRLGANLSLDRARDLDTGLSLVRRAHYNVKVSAGYVQGNWSAGADFQRTGARDDFGILTFVQTPSLLPAYSLARLVLAYGVSSRVQLHLRIENVFNAKYELVDGYNTLPRTIIGGVEARL